MTVRVDVLGPFRLVVDGQRIDVRRQQAVRALSLLTLRHDQGSSRNELIETMWSGQLPLDPASSLRVAVSRTRKYLDPHQECLVSTGDGFVLDADSDLQHAVAALRNPDEASVDELASALVLWRGSPLEALRDAPHLEPEIRALEEIHLHATVVLAERYNAAGDHSKAIGLTTKATDDTATDELLLAHVRALGGVGRRTEAIQVIAAHRQQLRDRFGTDPSAAIMQTEQTLLRDSSQLPRASPRQQPTYPVPEQDDKLFASRRRELDELHATSAGISLIVGEAGAGKSTLVQMFIQEHAERSQPTPLVASASQTPAVPMEPLAIVLASIASVTPESRWSSELKSSLSRLAPAALSRPETPPSSRVALLSMARDAIAQHLADTGSWLIIDDAQWLDRASAEVVQQLAIGPNVRVVLSTRSKQSIHMQRLAADAVHEVRVGALTRADVASIVNTKLAHGSQDTAIATILRLSGGNALFVAMLVDLLAEGALGEALPATVLLAVERRVQALSSGTRSAIQSASVFTGSFTEETLGAMHPDARAHLVEALDQGLIQATLETAEYEFRHALVADAIYQLLPDGVRVELHDEVGSLLARSGARPSEYAVHFGQAAVLDPVRAVRAHTDAASSFASDFDWDNAQLHIERGLDHHRTHLLGSHDFLGALLALQGRARRAHGDSSGDADLFAALNLAQETSDFALQIETIVALSSHGRIGTDEGDRVLSALRASLDRSTSQTERARLLAAGSTLMSVSPLQSEGRAMFREAAEICLRLGADDRTTQIEVWDRTHLGCPHPEDYPLRETAIAELERLANGDPDMQWEAAFLAFGMATARGDTSDAGRRVAELQALGPRLRVRPRDFGMLFTQAAWARYKGDLGEAERLVDDARVIGQRSFSEAWVMKTYIALITSIRQAQGRLGELLPFLDGLIEQEPSWPTWHCLASAAAAQSGDVARAQSELDWLRGQDFACLSSDLSWPAMLGLLSEAVDVTNDRDAAHSLLRLLSPLAGTRLWNGVCVHGTADEAIEIARRVAGSR